MARLTDRGIRAMKPTGKREQIADDNCRGLYLVVQKSGHKSWSVRYRAGDVQRRFQIGEYPTVGLSEARKRARRARANVQAGRDPQGEKEQAKAHTVNAVIADFKMFHLDKLKSGDNVHGFLKRSIVAEMGHRPIREITTHDLSQMLLRIVASGREVTANRTFAHVRKFFNWATQNGYIETPPPTDRMKMPAKEEARDRFLNDEEIRLFWSASETLGAPYKQALRLLLLTGQRHAEVVGMRESEVDGSLWSLPADRTKNGRPHDVPLSALALKALNEVPRIGDKGWIFTTTGEGPIWNLNDKADDCWKAMCKIAGHEIHRWRPHDLRRTFETGAAALGIADSVVDRITNHISAIPKMRRTYDRHTYLPEKRQALDVWASHVATVADGKTADNVVPLWGK